MTIEARIPLFDLIACISDAVDLISPAMNNHQMQVAYIAHAIAQECGWEPAQLADVLIAGACHDMGAFSSRERTDLLDFEVVHPHRHARVGYRLLSEFAPLATAGWLVRFHHVPWRAGAGGRFEGEEVPIESHALHLADRIAVMIKPQQAILSQARNIRNKITTESPRLFEPELVEAFCRLSLRDSFWLDATARNLAELLRRRVFLGTLDLDMDGLYGLAHLFRRMIDFRSRFTATHSSGVAASALALAKLAGFSERDGHLMEIAGYFHDLGKLAIPQEILQKPGHLDDHEYDILRSHVYHTYRILEPAGDLETIRTWGAFHQEYLDGTGYPFRLKNDELPQGSRIMAVADVFTALTEDRPYRKALPDNDAKMILKKLADDAKLDKDIIGILEANFPEVNRIRAEAQAASEIEYRQFLALVEQ